MKISIIGPSGGGKSTLARNISQKFAIPHLQIDRLWFENGGYDLFKAKSTNEVAKAAVQEQISLGITAFLAKHESWVSDGTYTKQQPQIADQADTIVLIKRPLWRRVLSAMKRVLTNDNRHPETTFWGDVWFTKTIIKRTRSGELEKLEVFCEQYRDKLIVLTSFKEIDAYFDSL